MGWEGIGTLIGKLSAYIPGRIEKLKNEREKLLNERATLLDGKPDLKSINRVVDINLRLCKVNQALGNAAKD